MLKLYAPGMTVEVLDLPAEPTGDTTPPETVLVFGPTDSPATTASITFTGTDTGGGPVTFEGSLDGGAWQSVESPAQLSGLAVGAHTYAVRARDAAGNVDATPAVVSWSVLPPLPIPAALTLVRKSPANTGTEYGGFNFQFNTACMIGGGRLFHEWNGTFVFDTITGAAEKRTVTTNDGSAPTTRPENCGMCYVPSLGLVYETTGAPVGPFRTFNPATNVSTILAGTQEGDQLFVTDPPRDRLLSIGGYTPPVDVRAYALPSGPWTTIPTTNNPIASHQAAKLGMYRGGASPTGRVGFFGDANELSELEGGATAWVNRPTTGVKPPMFSVFCYYAPLDAYFAWCGADVVAGANSPAVRKFYMLRRSSWHWQELDVTFPAVGAPTARAMCQNILVADPENEQLVLVIGDGYVRLYTLDLRGLL